MNSSLDASTFRFGDGFHAVYLEEAMVMLSTAYKRLANEIRYGNNYNENKLRDDLVKYIPRKREGMVFTFDTESRNLDRDNVRIDITIITLEVLCQLEDDFEKRITIECKIIGVDQYINRNGIISYVEGKYASQLPVAGMIGFVFDQTIDTVKKRINEKLRKHAVIITEEFLNPVRLLNNFPNSYKSKHRRMKKLSSIELYHLLLDYSSIVN